MCLLKVRVSHGLHLGVSPHLGSPAPMVRGSAPSFEKWSPSSFHSDDRGSVEDPSGYLGVGESDLQTDPAGWTKICWAPAFAILCPGFLVKHRGFFSLFLHQPSVPKKTRCFGCLLSEFAVQNLVVLPQKSDIAQVRGVPCGGPTGVPQGSNRGPAVTARSAARPHRAPRPPADLLLGTDCAGAR